MEKQQQWWNGRWGRLARVDVVLYRDGTRWVVEHRIGGVEGRSEEQEYASEEAARARVDELLASADGWREL